MKTTLSHKRYNPKENDVESIDVHDLPEEEAQLAAAFVEFLRQHKGKYTQAGEDHVQVPSVEAPGKMADILFAAWPLGVKGTLRREEIYDYL